MLRFYYISTNLRSHLSANKVLYIKFTIKVQMMFEVIIVTAPFSNFGILCFIKRASLINKIFQSRAESIVLV